MRRVEKLILAVIAVSFVIGIALYPEMPELMASHWNAAGEVDGYMPKFWGLFLMPIITLGMFLLFLAIPRIDPLKANIEKFRGNFDWFILIIIFFMFYIYLLTLVWSMGYRFSIIQLMSPAFAVLFYYAGILIQNAKRNWFIGIRTPWTLSSTKVWDKTHRLGAKMFKTAAVIMLAGVLMPDYAIYFILVPILSATFYLIIYSYREYQKLGKK